MGNARAGTTVVLPRTRPLRVLTQTAGCARRRPACEGGRRLPGPRKGRCSPDPRQPIRRFVVGVYRVLPETGFPHRFRTFTVDGAAAAAVVIIRCRSDPPPPRLFQWVTVDEPARAYGSRNDNNNSSYSKYARNECSGANSWWA